MRKAGIQSIFSTNWKSEELPVKCIQSQTETINAAPLVRAASARTAVFCSLGTSRIAMPPTSGSQVNNESTCIECSPSRRVLKNLPENKDHKPNSDHQQIVLNQAGLCAAGPASHRVYHIARAIDALVHDVIIKPTLDDCQLFRHPTGAVHSNAIYHPVIKPCQKLREPLVRPNHSPPVQFT